MSENRATDTRPPVIIIEETVVDDFDLDPLAGWLYVVIVRHINRKNNDAFPSVKRLAALARMSRASVLRYTKVLEDKHLIKVERETDESTKEREVNHYKLLSATRVVSVGYQGGDYVKPGVVSESDYNQIDINQKNLTNKDQEIPAPEKGADRAPANPAPKIEPSAVVEEKKGAEATNVIAFPQTAEIPRAAFHAVTAQALNLDGAAYGLIEKYANFLTGTMPEFNKKKRSNGDWFDYQISPGMSYDELGGYAEWCAGQYNGINRPSTCEAMNRSVARFRNDKNHGLFVKRFEHLRVVMSEKPPPPINDLPVAAGGEGQSYRNPERAALAKQMISDLTQQKNGNTRGRQRQQT